MPLITETYYLSLTQDNRGILRLRCSQDDTLRTVNLKLYNNGSIFAIPSGVSASISGVKQNGAVFSKPCTISQDRESVVLQLSSDITNIDGIIVAEIVLNDGEGGRLGTSNFIIQVEKNPIRAGVVQDTETPIEYINDFIEKIQTLTARLNNLITPSGDASLAEVVDARISSLDGNTYQNLKARIDADIATLNTGKADKSEVYTKSQIDGLLENIEIDVDDELSDESENPVQNKVINRAIGEIKADLDAIEPGLSDAAKAALLNCFEHVAWSDSSGQMYYDDLRLALYDISASRGAISLTYPYIDSNDRTRCSYCGLGMILEPNAQYKIEFDGGDNPAIDVGIKVWNNAAYNAIQNNENLDNNWLDDQGWQRSGYTFITTANQKLLWLTFRKDAGDVNIYPSEVGNIILTCINPNAGEHTAVYTEVIALSGYHANHTSEMVIPTYYGGETMVAVNDSSLPEINFEGCRVSKIRLKIIQAGTISLGVVKKSLVEVDNPVDWSKVHRKVTVNITNTGLQTVSFEPFPVALDEALCVGFSNEDASYATATWTYGSQSTDKGRQYRRTRDYAWQHAGSSIGIDAYIIKRTYT